MSGSGIAPDTRKRCYERDGYLCQNPKCPHRDAVRVLQGGVTVWKNRRWDGTRWRQIAIHLHHCFFRSRYHEEDRHDDWNLCTLCSHCHKSLHSESEKGKELEKWCIALAESRHETAAQTPVHRKERKGKSHKRRVDVEAKKRARDRNHNDYRKRIEAFKQRNDGLTPSQVQYRRQKEWKRQQEMKNL